MRMDSVAPSVILIRSVMLQVPGMGDDKNSDTNITSHGQSGGITAYNVTVNGSPPPPAATPKPLPWWRSTWALISGFLVVTAALVTVLAYFHVQPKERPVPDDKKFNVTSFNQSGGITAGTVHIGSQPRTLSDPQLTGLKAQILRDVPRTKPITVIALMGDAESYRFGAEIHAFLKANGYNMAEPTGISQAIFTPPPVGVGLQDKGDHLDFIVGSKP